MTPRPASQDLVLPRPRRVCRLGGRFSLREKLSVVLRPVEDPIVAAAVRELRRLLGPRLHKVTARRPPERGPWVGLERASSPRGSQWYSLRIRPPEIRLRASSDAGFLYGVRTLAQLCSPRFTAIRNMLIEDWPDFAVRGVMLDISRDKVPTLSTLKQLIDLLAGWRINQLQLYMENAFAYQGHEKVWRGSSPLTGAQIRELDEHCRSRGIDLVPNQNSLGHMERWLQHPSYARFAECTGPWETPWGEVRRRPGMLCPVGVEAIRFMSSLYGQLLPNFSSRLINVGCDEPWELGQGRSRTACRRRGDDRVYFDYLVRVRGAVRRHRLRTMFWADWIVKHPHLIRELPDDMIPLVWGYEADHPFDRQCARLRRRGLDFYVCPGTSSWCSIGGRIANCLTNLRNAATSGLKHRALGYLITDWGDFGHRQYLPVSYGGFLYGAALSWCLRTNADIDVAEALSRHVFQDPTGLGGRAWMEAGRIHERSGVMLHNRTVLFNVMQSPLGDIGSVEGLEAGASEHMGERLRDLAALARRAKFGGSERELVREELLATLAVLRHAGKRAEYNVACREGRRTGGRLSMLAADMKRIIARHRGLWLARNRRGGLAHSTAYYRRILREYVPGNR